MQHLRVGAHISPHCSQQAATLRYARWSCARCHRCCAPCLGTLMQCRCARSTHCHCHCPWSWSPPTHPPSTMPPAASRSASWASPSTAERSSKPPPLPPPPPAPALPPEPSVRPPGPVVLRLQKSGRACWPPPLGAEPVAEALFVAADWRSPKACRAHHQHGACTAGAGERGGSGQVGGLPPSARPVGRIPTP